MILYRENMRFARERKKSENFHFCERERERERFQVCSGLKNLCDL